MTPAPFRSGPRVAPTERVRSYARVLVRAGLLDDAAVLSEVRAAAHEDVGGDAERLAADAVDAARRELALDQESWSSPTDLDRLGDAFDELSANGIVVLRAVEDHWAATAELTRRDESGERVAGIMWFTPADVWHAVEHAMLEVNLWHGDSANVAAGDALLAGALEILRRHGLAARFDEGRIEVAVRWEQRR